MTEADLIDHTSPEDSGDEIIQNNDSQPDAPPTLPDEQVEAMTVDKEPAADAGGAHSVEAASPSFQPTRQSATYRPTTLAVGILLIALGIILVWPVFSGGYILVAEVIIAIVIAGVALSLLAYWLNTGRRARGAFFLAILGLLWAGLTDVLLFDTAAVAAGGNWPFYIVALGGAILVTAIANRQRDTRLLSPGLICIVAGLAALAVTRQWFPPQALSIVHRVWPWLVMLAVLGMLPLAIRRVPHQE